MKKFTIFTIALLMLTGGIVYLVIFNSAFRYQRVTVGGVTLVAEVADTPQQRYRGLSGRETLDQEEAMLFSFDEAGSYPFSMRGMRFPLDFIFILNDKVVAIVKNVPSNFGNAVLAQGEFNKVLEVNAGFSQRHDVREGDHVEYQNANVVDKLRGIFR